MARAASNRKLEATVLSNIGLAWINLNKYKKALKYLQQALPIRRIVGDRIGEASTLNGIGKAWFFLGRKRKALELYEEALAITRAVGDQNSEAMTCFNIGQVYEALLEFDQAILYVERCVHLDIENKHPDLESDRLYLKNLQRKQHKGASGDEIMQMLSDLYEEDGEGATRDFLKKHGNGDKTIEYLISILKSN